MNFSTLSAYYPDLERLGNKAEDLIRDRYYSESTQVLRQFAEAVLKILLKRDNASLGELMREDLFYQLADSKTVENFRRVRRLGNEASHFSLTKPTQVGQRSKDYCVRTEEDAARCLKYAHAIAVWLMSLAHPNVQYPEFQSIGTIYKKSDGLIKTTVFNSYQQKAIELLSGEHVVLASPGCGKTEILTERIRFALDKGVQLKDMLCLTFTNRAARGMQERIAQRFNDQNMGELYVGNLHRFCSRILFENEVVHDDATIMDEDDVRDLIEGILLDLLPDGSDVPTEPLPSNVAATVQQRASRLYQQEHDFPEEIQVQVDYFYIPPKKTSQLMEFNLLKREDGTVKHNQEVIDKAAERYLTYKEEQHLLDFNDLLLKTWVYLNENSDSIKRYAWVQVDEVQDLSPLQLSILDQLWDPSKSTSVRVYFGDEQQAIFSFMGAKPDMLATLCQTFELHRLFRNFRSPSYLLDLFNEFAVNELHCDPRILPQAEKQCEKPDGALQLLSVADELAQLELVVKMLSQVGADETTAIIVPFNNDADVVSRVLKAAKIEHFKISGSDIFKQNILKVAKAYISILKDDYRPAPWAQLLYRLTPKATSVKKIRDFLSNQFPEYGLLASDLMIYNSENGPVSALDDFTLAYQKELIVFDTETTGLNVGVDEVVQIAAVKLQGGQIVDRLVLFLETQRPIPEMLGDIVNPMIEEYEAHRHELVTPEEGFRQFLDFVGAAPVVGHNVEYDANIVNAQYAVLKAQLDKETTEELNRDLNQTKLVKRFDTLKLSHALEREICKAAGLKRLRSHKLKDLIAVLGLEGQNSHKADDDVEATVHLLRWFYQHAVPLIENQKRYLKNPNLQRMSQTLRNSLYAIYVEHKDIMYRSMDSSDEAILVQVFRQLIETLPNYTHEEEQIENIRKKLPLIYEYLDKVLINSEESRTLYAQLQRYLVQINSLKETDLCSSAIVKDKVFISTVHKAKGLEFDRVIVTDVREGTYPFFSSRTEKAIQEDARKLYVAMSRAKQTLTLICPSRSHGYPASASRFLNGIRHHFKTASYTF